MVVFSRFKRDLRARHAVRCSPLAGIQLENNNRLLVKSFGRNPKLRPEESMTKAVAEPGYRSVCVVNRYRPTHRYILEAISFLGYQPQPQLNHSSCSCAIETGTLQFLETANFPYNCLPGLSFDILTQPRFSAFWSSAQLGKEMDESRRDIF
jgi:hypothetical protein